MIRKCVVTVEFLFDEELDPEPQVDDYDLAAISEEMDHGTLIGRIISREYSDVQPEHLLPLLRTYGNDGTFFELERNEHLNKEEEE